MNELCKNQIHQAEITGYGSGGEGVCRIDGRAVFVEQTLMGEVWSVLILKVTKTAVYGKGVELITPSAQRCVPSCELFGKCGGCDLLHMIYAEEVRMKLDRVNGALKHIGGLDFTVDKILSADDDGLYHYRNKAIYAISRDDQGLGITGFFRERSHSIILVKNCLIQTELSTKCAEALRAFMDETNISVYDEKTGKGQLRHLYTRCSRNLPQSVACIVTAKGLHEHTDQLVACLREKCPELTGIVLCINKNPGNVVLDGSFHTLWGNEIIEDELCGLKFKISPQSFYQINPPQAERLYDLALEYACPPGTGTVLDLYCGTGTITLCLARGAKMVYGAEIIEAAVLNARQNADENGITNAKFILGDAAEAAKQLQKDGIKPDAVVVDPPRKGLTPDVIDTIVQLAPARVVYVSCDPATLARDLKSFAQNGYAPVKATAVDMFPRCAHVETVVLLAKAEQ